MKRIYLLPALLLLLFFLGGCGAVESEETPVPELESEPNEVETVPEGGVFPRATVTNSPPAEEGYPAPPTTIPQPEGYTTGVVIEPTANPYPIIEGYVWVMRPAGVQCESGIYASVQDATKPLLDAGIIVNAQTSIELNTCAACGCPTSTYYRAQIPLEDLSNAATFGWERED